MIQRDKARIFTFEVKSIIIKQIPFEILFKLFLEAIVDLSPMKFSRNSSYAFDP